MRGLDPKLKKLLKGQGELKAKIDQWGRQLLQGQGEIKSILKEIAKENLAEHRKTQTYVKGLQKASFQAGLRQLIDGTELLKNDRSSAMGDIGRAKGKLMDTEEYLDELEMAGDLILVEQRALIHLGLASCYIAQGLNKRAVSHLIKLNELPSQGNGFERFITILKTQITELKLKAFETNTPEDRVYAKSMEQVFKNLSTWLDAIQPERQRLAMLKSKTQKLVMGNETLKALWLKMGGEHASTRSEAKEDDLALQAFATLSAQLIKLKYKSTPTHKIASRPNIKSLVKQSKPKSIIIQLVSVEVKSTRSNGEAWDNGIPFIETSILPDIYVEIMQGKRSVLITPVTKNSLTANYIGQSVTVTSLADVTVTVWDKDLRRPDAAGTVTLTDQNGDVTLSGGGVKALKLSISGNK